MTSDQEPRYRLVDANGNIVGSLYGKPDGSVAIQETASGADREVTLAPDGTFSAPSVETESVTTGRLDTGPKNVVEHVKTKSPSGGEVQFTGLDLNDRYAIQFHVTGDDDIQMTFDEDDADGSYTYWDDSGTRLSGEDTITLVSASSFHRAGGDVLIGGGNQGYPGFNNQLNMGRANNISGFASKGGANFANASSVEIDIGGSSYASEVHLTRVRR